MPKRMIDADELIVGQTYVFTGGDLRTFSKDGVVTIPVPSHTAFDRKWVEAEIKETQASETEEWWKEVYISALRDVLAHHSEDKLDMVEQPDKLAEILARLENIEKFMVVETAAILCRIVALEGN